MCCSTSILFSTLHHLLNFLLDTLLPILIWHTPPTLLTAVNSRKNTAACCQQHCASWRLHDQPVVPQQQLWHQQLFLATWELLCTNLQSAAKQAVPSKLLNTLIYIRFSFGQMFFTSEAVQHTQVDILNADCINWWWQLLLVSTANLL